MKILEKLWNKVLGIAGRIIIWYRYWWIDDAQD